MSKNSPRKLLRQIDRLVSTSDWEVSARRLARHPELLTPDADRLLGVLVGESRRTGDIGLAGMYRYHRQLLRICRHVGVDAAIARERDAALRRHELVQCGAESLTLFRDTGDELTLHRAVASFEEAAHLTVTGHPDTPVVLTNLGVALVDLFDHDSRRRHVRRAVTVLSRAVKWSDPGSRERSAAVANLGIALTGLARVDTSGHAAAKAVAVLKRAVELAADPDEEASRHDNLGLAYAARYRSLHHPRDLDRAVAAHRASVPRDIRKGLVHSPPPSDVELLRLTNLSAAVAERYAVTGNPADLDDALDLATWVLAVTPPQSPQILSRTDNCALLFRDRYMRDGDLTDLDDAVELLSSGLDETPDLDPELPGRLDQLATTLRMRAVRRRDPDELHRAMTLHRRAARAPLDNAERPLVLGNLAGSLRVLASSSTTSVDRQSLLLEALDTSRLALACVETPEDRAAMESTIGAVLLELFAVDSDPAHLDEAEHILELCVGATDRGSPELSARLNNLGNALRYQYARNRKPAYAARATAAYRRGAQHSSEGATQAGLRCAINWGVWATHQSWWEEALGAFQEAQRFAERLVALQIARRDKESWLLDVETISAAAAYCSAAVGDPRSATVFLEWGRARLLTDTLERDRADLATISESHADLALRFTAVAARVRALELTPLNPSSRRAAPVRKMPITVAPATPSV